MRENDLLAKLPKLFTADDSSVVVGVGPDDCAHVISPDSRLAFSTDAFVEHVHFLPEDAPGLVAVKVIAASVSDLAASACRPMWALVSLCLKRGAPEDWAEQFAESLAHTAQSYSLAVVGGDTTSSPNDTMISVTVAGVPLPGGPLLRRGAKPGDEILVSGRLGGSILGRHLRPAARVREIAALMDYCQEQKLTPPSAGMDISDGLALDLSRLCRESGTGAVIEEARIPVSVAAERLAEQTGSTPLHHALSDGEDFELLVTLSPDSWRVFKRDQVGLGCVDIETGEALFRSIGRVTEVSDMLMFDPHGISRSLAPEGFQHKW